MPELKQTEYVFLRYLGVALNWCVRSYLMPELLDEGQEL